MKGKKFLTLPYILDSDPIRAANSLTLEDEVSIMKLVKETYEKLGEKDQPNIAFEKMLRYSKSNFDWFALFAIELFRINEQKVEVPYNKVRITGEMTDLFLFPPLTYSGGKAKADLPRGTEVNPIVQYRILYISQAHEAQEFRDGFPAWYVFSDTTLYEHYSNTTGVRARIDFNNGEFHYYIAGASDNWKQIVGVPLEMDSIVSNLLFRN